MAGHSKFANIKHKKEREDNKRGKVFTRLAREIVVAVKEGGKELEFNPRLRVAIDRAKGANMPKDNIDRAIKKGAGEIEGGELVEIRYEGYGPGGVAFIVTALTDNKNRTASEVRHAFNKYGGSLGETGSVGWIFEKHGLIVLENSGVGEEEIMDLVVENNLDDFEIAEGDIYLFCSAQDLYKNVEVCSSKYKVKEAKFHLLPSNFVDADSELKDKIENMSNHLEGLDDTQEVFCNIKNV